MQVEIWKSIKGYEGIYDVSSFGSVRSLGFLCKGNVGQTCFKKGKLLAKVKATNGYIKAGLFKDGSRVLKSVHRLVAMEFVSNPEKKPQVNHIDGNKRNNHYLNLEWCSPKENTIHAHDNLLVKSKKGILKIYQNKKVVQYDLKGNKISEFESVNEASKSTGIFSSNITRCAKGRSKRTKDCKWKYA